MTFFESRSGSRFLPSLLLAIVSRSSLAQLVHVPTQLNPDVPAMTTTAFAPSFTLVPSTTRTFATTPFQSTETSSSRTSRVTRDAEIPAILVAQSDDIPPDLEEKEKESVFNYYFLILAFFAVTVAIFLWWIRLRRKRRKAQLRLSGQHALARDLDGWITTRRWIHGSWRPYQTTAFLRREEGFNEYGEAPPPYEPKTSAAAVPQDPTTFGQDPASGLTIPLRTLSRDRVDMVHPPHYDGSDDQQSRLTSPLGLASGPTCEGTFPAIPRIQPLRDNASQLNG